MLEQSSLVNVVALMSASQEREEKVRSYLARYRGLVGGRPVECTAEACMEKVSYANRLILHALVRGLYDSETKEELLSKNPDLDQQDKKGRLVKEMQKVQGDEHCVYCDRSGVGVGIGPVSQHSSMTFLALAGSGSGGNAFKITLSGTYRFDFRIGPDKRSQSKSWKEMEESVTTVKVANDVAERGIKVKHFEVTI